MVPVAVPGRAVLGRAGAAPPVRWVSGALPGRAVPVCVLGVLLPQMPGWMTNAVPVPF